MHDHKIPVIQGSAPMVVRLYRYPHFQKGEIERQVKELLSTGVIRPTSSPYSLPLLLVKKKDDNLRICIDYWALNKVTIKDKFYIFNIDELLDELHTIRYFSNLIVWRRDLQNNLSYPSRPLWDHSDVIWSLKCAIDFRSLMSFIFYKYLRKFILVFFDDILIYSSTWWEHLVHLGSTFEILQHNYMLRERSAALLCLRFIT